MSYSNWWRSNSNEWRTRYYQSSLGFLMQHHPLTNCEIQKYYQNKPKFNGIYSRNNLPKLKHETHMINLDKYESEGTNWIAACLNDDSVTYFNTFGVEYILKEIKSIGNKNITTNIYRIKANDLMTCGYLCNLLIFN